MISDALAALRQIFTPEYRTVLWKVLGLTLVLLAIVSLLLFKLLTAQMLPLNAWVATALSVVSGLGMVVGSIFLIPPASMVVAGFFLDELAEKAESDIYPADRIGRALPLGQAMVTGLRFAAVSLLVNLVALLLLLVPGINAGVFLVANAFLFAREYFALAALRYMPMDAAISLRNRHSLQVYGAGLLIALFVSVPVLNLVTPLFGTAFMVRLVKRLCDETRYITKS